MVAPSLIPPTGLPSLEPPGDWELIDADGSLTSIGLINIPISGTLVASVAMQDASVVVRISKIVVFQRTETLVPFDPIDFPPGEVPEEPEVVSQFTELRRVEGNGPIVANPGEEVFIRAMLQGASSDFGEAHGEFFVEADTWDRISLPVRVFQKGSVAVDVKEISLSVRQGEVAGGEVPVRWDAGLPSEVWLGIFRRDPEIAIDVVAPLRTIGHRESVTVPFAFRVPRNCPPGLHQLEGMISGSDGTPFFTINLDVIAVPPPPPPKKTDLGGPFSLQRTGTILRLVKTRITPQQTLEDETITTLDIGGNALSDEEKDRIIAETEAKAKEYFAKIGTDVTAAEAGAAIYGAASAAVVAVTLGPAAALPFVGPAAVKLSSNVGEFYGSIVDDFAKVLKGQDEARASELIGTMAVLFFTQVTPIVGQIDMIRFMGADGWALTREIGKKLGSGLEDAVDAIGSAADDVGGAIGDAIDFVGGIFGL